MRDLTLHGSATRESLVFAHGDKVNKAFAYELRHLRLQETETKKVQQDASQSTLTHHDTYLYHNHCITQFEALAANGISVVGRLGGPRLSVAGSVDNLRIVAVFGLTSPTSIWESGILVPGCGTSVHLTSLKYGPFRCLGWPDSQCLNH